MLETEIKKLTAALDANTEALKGTWETGSATTTPASEPSTQGTTSDTAPAEASEPAPTVAEMLAPPAAPVVPDTTKAEVKVPTKKALVEKFIELAQTKDREVAVKLLADFGVAKLPELTDKSKWAAFIDAVDALLAG